MKRLLAVLGLSASVLAPVVHAQITCPYFNNPWSNNQSAQDTKEHVVGGGDHRDTVNFSGSCSYGPQNLSYQCSVECSESTTGLYSDGEDLTNILYEHVLDDTKVNGNGGSNGAAVTCGGTVGFGVLSCLKVFGCNLTVTINGTIEGLGGSVTYNPTSTLYQTTMSYPYTCVARLNPACNPIGPPPPPLSETGWWTWNQPTCAWVWHEGKTPIIIDTDGSGFHLTSAEKGITWDFFGNGQPVQMAWTAPGSTNGWLAIDLNGNGTIDSAKELFGNISPQPASNNPNGFAALAV